MSRVKQKKKETPSKLKKRLWNTFSKYIRIRDAISQYDDIQYVDCCTCGQTKEIKNIDAGHFIPAGSCNKLRFEEKNVHAQCRRCNSYFSGEQDLYAQFIENTYGKDELKRLRKERWETKKDSIIELRQMIKLYKKKLKNLTDEYGNPWQ